VLQRTSGLPKLRAIDRVLLAAASRTIPRDRWVAFLVTPSTLLRWHRELVRRSGRTAGRAALAGRRSILRSVRSSSGSPGRTRAGAASGSRASSGSSASEPARRRSGPCFGSPGSVPHRGAAGRPGPSSCGPRRRASSPATSSAWRPHGSEHCMSWCSSSSAAGGST
jgi:hypothetical protein